MPHISNWPKSLPPDSEGPAFISPSAEKEFWQHLLNCDWCRGILYLSELSKKYDNCFEDEVFWAEVQSYLEGNHPTPEHFVESLTYAYRGLDNAGILDWAEDLFENSDEPIDQMVKPDQEVLDAFNQVVKPVKRIFHHMLVCQACYDANMDAWVFLWGNYTKEEIMRFNF